MKALKQISALFMCLCILFCSTLSTAFFVKSDTATVFDKVVRLHVLANSDSAADQEQKLRVRNKIIEVTSRLFEGCTDIEQAKDIASKNISLIQKAAQEVISLDGCDYSVTVQNGVETYPVRRYGDFVFPAGRYFSLRVKIGQAKGKNWWCVLFPPMCSTVYTKCTDEDLDILCNHGFSEQLANSLVSGGAKPIVKFKIYEIIKEALK